jgi:hypothetical protein
MVVETKASPRKAEASYWWPLSRQLTLLGLVSGLPVVVFDQTAHQSHSTMEVEGDEDRKIFQDEASGQDNAADEADPEELLEFNTGEGRIWLVKARG